MAKTRGREAEVTDLLVTFEGIHDWGGTDFERYIDSRRQEQSNGRNKRQCDKHVFHHIKNNYGIVVHDKMVVEHF